MDYPEEQRLSRKNIVTVASVILMTMLPVGGYASPLKVGVVGAANPAVAALGKDNVRQTLVLGKDVFFDQTIVTDGKGSLQLLFLDKSALTVGPNSSLKIDKFVYNPENSSGEMTITSTKGAFRFIGGALSKKNAVKIKTPVSTIGIRGGIAMVDVSPESGATNATFVYGTEMAIENKNGDKQVTTEAGSGMTVLTPTSPPTAPVKVDVAVLSENIKQLESSEGQHGGTTTVPDEKTVNDKITTSEEKSGVSSTEPASGSEKSSTSSEGESKSSSSEEKSQESSSGESKSSTSTSSESKDSSGTPPVQENATAATPEASVPLAPISDVGTKPVVGAVDSMTPQVNPVAIIPPVVTNITDAVTRSEPPTEPKPEPKPTSKCGSATSPCTTTTESTEPKTTTGTTGTPPPTTTTTEPKPTTTDATTTTISGSSAGNAVAVAPTVTHKGQYVIKNNIAANKSGNVNAHVELDKFNTALNQESPTAANSPAAMVKNTTVNRFDSVSKGRVNGIDYEGISYRSLNDKMHYYQLSKVDYPSEQIAMVVGERLAKAALPTTGLDFFHFLPELQQHHSGTTTQLGFFDWNMADSGLLPVNTVPLPDASLMGLAVHWNSGTYFSGYMNFDYTGPTDYKHLLKVAFGKVNSAGDGPVFTGRSIDISGSNAAASTLKKQYNRVNENIYGSSSNVDGFLIERMNPTNLVAAGTDPFTVVGTVTQQPMMKGNAPSGVPVTRTTETLTGFMSGFMKNNINGTPTYARYTSGYFTITKDASANSIGAIVNLTPLDSGTPTMLARFGSDAVGVTPHQVFVSNKIYAIEQGNLTYNGTAVNRVDGVLVGSYISTNSALKCTQCTYVDWGVWAAEAEATSGGAVDLAHMMPYVTGTLTQNMGNSAQNGQTAEYTGKVIGNVLTGSALTHQNGTFTVNINLGAAPTVTSFSGNLGDHNFYSSTLTIAPTGPATFSGNITGHSGNLTGYVSGGLFGPAAQDIGGSIKFGHGSTKATGVYLGSVTP